MNLETILKNKIMFKGVDDRFYTVKNKSKFLGKNKTIHYNTDNELEYIKLIEDDQNILHWHYKNKKIKFDVTYQNKKIKETFRPTFYILTNGNETVNKFWYSTIDKKHQEYLIYLADDEEDIYLLDEEDYLKLSINDQNFYDYSLNIVSYNQRRYEAADKFCRENGMTFIVRYANGKTIKILQPEKFH